MQKARPASASSLAAALAHARVEHAALCGGIDTRAGPAAPVAEGGPCVSYLGGLIGGLIGCGRPFFSTLRASQ
jgi:hypothetical protein